jgi:transcriptional regulator with XRE-family HTH domain
MSATLTVSNIDIRRWLRHTALVDRLYKQFGRLLRDFRREAKLTQDQVAERVHLKRTSITNIERGRQHIALHQLFLLASAVGVSPAELLPDSKLALQELLPDQMATLRAAGEDEEDFDFAARVLSRGQIEKAETGK